MSIGSAHGRFVRKSAKTAAYCGGIAGLLVLFGADALQNAIANGDTRTISFHHIHLKEDTTVTFKVNGRYDEAALKKVSWALRDWRTQNPTTMDPHLIDALWEVHRETGSKDPIHVIGGYRSPATNAMLRRRSSGVAKSSQHMLGKAVDFFIPDVPLEAVRDAGLRLQRGGVGFYPTSGSPFIHMDVGSVRHWPRLPEAQLARVMAKGPLTRYASAPSPKQFVQSIARTLVGQDEVETTSQAASAPTRTASTPARAETPARVAAANVPMPRYRPAAQPAAEEEAPAPAGFSLASASTRAVPAPERPARAASLVANANISANDVINERGYWQGLVEPGETTPRVTAAARAAAPRPPADIPQAESAVAEATGTVATAGLATASLAPWSMPQRKTNGPALAYAPAVTPETTPRAPIAGSATRTTAPRDTTTVAVKRPNNRPASQGPAAETPAAGTNAAVKAVKLNDPWMRAMILSPNAQEFMSTSLFGGSDFRSFASYLQKPQVSVMMTFSDNPHLGMSSDHFQGHAVVFVSTVTFSRQTAAALR